MPADLAVIGLGPYGLPLAQAAVAAGIHTVGYATGPEAGSLSPAELRRMHAAGFRLASDPAQLGRVRTAVICAPTPRGADGSLDLGQVEAAARTVAARLRPHTTVILESPVLPGATEDFLRPLLEEGSGLRAGRDFHLAYSPAGSTPAAATTRRPVRPGSSAASRPPAPSRPPRSTAGSPTRWSARAGCARRRPCSCWRRTTGTSTSRSSTRWPSSATSWASTCGTSSAARRPSPSDSRRSGRARASAGTGSRRT